MRVLEGEGGGGTVLPRLRAQVVVEAGAGRHGLRVEVRREGAVLRNTVDRHVTDTSALHGRTAPRPSQPPSCARKHAPHGHPEGPGAWMGRMTPRAVHSSVHCGEPGVCNSTLPCACARAARRQRMWRNSARHAHHAREQRSATAASSLEFNVDVKDSRAGRRAAQTHAHQERQHGNKLARARPRQAGEPYAPGAQKLACSMPHAPAGLQAAMYASTRVGDARHACRGSGRAEQRANSLVALTIGLGLQENEATHHVFFFALKTWSSISGTPCTVPNGGE